MTDLTESPQLLPQLRRLPLRLLLLVAAAHVIPLTTALVRNWSWNIDSLVFLIGLALTVATVISAARGRTTWRTGAAFSAISLLSIWLERTTTSGTGIDSSPAFAYAVMAAITFSVTLWLPRSISYAAAILISYLVAHKLFDPTGFGSAVDEVAQVTPAVIAIAFATATVGIGTQRADAARAEQLAASLDEAKAEAKSLAGREAQLRMHDLTIPALTSVARESIPDLAAVRQACAEAANAIQLEGEQP